MSVNIQANDSEKVFSVLLTVVNMSETLKTMVEDLGGGENLTQVVKLDQVNSFALKKYIEYCEHYANSTPELYKSHVDKINEWDKEFMKLSDPEIFCLMNAANFLHIEPLTKLCCKTVADEIKGKSPEQIRERFGIVNDFSPEEEAELRKTHAWVLPTDELPKLNENNNNNNNTDV